MMRTVSPFEDHRRVWHVERDDVVAEELLAEMAVVDDLLEHDRRSFRDADVRGGGAFAARGSFAYRRVYGTAPGARDGAATVRDDPCTPSAVSPDLSSAAARNSKNLRSVRRDAGAKRVEPDAREAGDTGAAHALARVLDGAVHDQAVEENDRREGPVPRTCRGPSTFKARRDSRRLELASCARKRSTAADVARAGRPIRVHASLRA